MDGSRLLDANLLIAYLENERAVVERALEADAVYVSVVALGELHFGARKSKRLNQNLNRIASFCSGPRSPSVTNRRPNCMAL
jgi:tRNA(fMet)-specific endonuclease VapC